MSVDKVCNILFTNVMPKATLVTDEAGIYKFVGTQYADHQTVWHAAAEYVNKEGYTTNNVENFFGVSKKAWLTSITSAVAALLGRIFVPLLAPLGPRHQ